MIEIFAKSENTFRKSILKISDLSDCTVCPMDGDGLADQMHSRGINMRYIGHVLKLVSFIHMVLYLLSFALASWSCSQIERLCSGPRRGEAGRLGADARRWGAHCQGSEARPAHAAAVGQAGAGSEKFFLHHFPLNFHLKKVIIMNGVKMLIVNLYSFRWAAPSLTSSRASSRPSEASTASPRRAPRRWVFSLMWDRYRKRFG